MPFPYLPSPPTIFPIYLLPSIPFRRRKSSSDSTSTATFSDLSSSPGSPSSTSPPRDPPYLSGHTSHLRCSRCSTDLALTSQIISKGFTGRHGRAYLVSPHAPSQPSSLTVHTPPSASPSLLPNLLNTHTHKPVPRQLVTGMHTVSDVSCALCGNVLGWKYVAADEESQRYKVGKFILETKRVCASSYWENGEARELPLPPVYLDAKARGGRPGADEEEVEFDSQDEDECEDLFAGVWSPQLASKRRKGRRFRRACELPRDLV